MTPEIQEQIQKCNKLLERTPTFETKPENGYGHIQVKYDENYEKPILWVAQNIDPTMTLIDLQQLEKHIQDEINLIESLEKYEKQIKLSLNKCDTDTQKFYIKLLTSEKITILNQSLEGWDQGFCVDVLSIDCEAEEPIAFDNGRLKFKKGEKFTIIATVDEKEDITYYGTATVQQIIYYADGEWDIKYYDYIDFTKTQDI